VCEREREKERDILEDEVWGGEAQRVDEIGRG
jgi:hypothetical protein